MSIQSLKRRWLGLALFIGMFTLLLSCSQSNIQETGSATLGIATQALSAGDVQRVTITISGANISPSIVQNLVKAGNQWKGIIGKIPTGSGRTFLAQAYDNSTGGNLIYEGTAANVTITKGQPVTVVILLQQKNAPTPFDNKVPVINSVVASSNAVGPGETVNLTVNATDPDTGDTLSYTWSAGAGSFSSTSTTSTVWTAPSSSGSNTINIEVKDQKDGKVTASLNIDIQSFHSRGKAKLQVSFNTWPEVAGVTASKGRINVNETTDLAVTASDNDNDTLIYAWASDCGGSFSSTSASNPTFTSPGTAPTSGNCKLTVTVTDGNGGTNTGDITIQIGAPVAANSAPILETTFQSEENILAGGAVTLRVVARDPESGNMTISWSEQGGPNGTLGTPTTTGTTSEVVWTAASGKCGGVVRVTITDDGNPNATTTHDFTIACDCPSGQTECAATCVDTQTSTSHCGTCGTACSSGQTCSAGACLSPAFANLANTSAGKFSQTFASTTDSNGNIFITGAFTGSMTLGTLSPISAVSTRSSAFVAKMDSSGTFLWAKRFGGTRANAGYGVTTDSSGNLYVAINGEGTVTYGTTTINAGIWGEVVIVKFDTNGNILFAKQNGTSGNSSFERPHDIKLDGSGNIYVAGFFRVNTPIGLTNRNHVFGSTTLVSPSGTVRGDIFVAKMDSSGNWLWVKMYSSTSNPNLRKLAVDSSGNSYINGWMTAATVFGGTTITPTGANDGFVAKIDSSGTLQWAKHVAASSGADAISQGIVLNGSDLYISGYFSGTATLGTTNLISSGAHDAFVAKLDSSGNYQWVKQTGTGSGDILDAYVAFSGSHIYVGGQTTGTSTFGTTNASSVFVAKLDASGSVVAAQSGGNSNSISRVFDVFGVGGGVLVSGRSLGSTTFGLVTLNAGSPFEGYIALFGF